MGLFANADAIKNADSDPFGLPVGRQEVYISESEEITIGKEKKYRVWKIEFTNEEKRHSDLLCFLDGEATDKMTAEEAQEKNNGKIKAVFEALEIPESRYESVGENPSQLVGQRVVVNVTKSGERKYVNLVGLAKGAPAPVTSAPAT